MERAAARYNMTVDTLKDVQEGPSRRCKHDDVTCVVFFFQGNEKNDGFVDLLASAADGQSDPAKDDEIDDDDAYTTTRYSGVSPPPAQ